MSVDEEDIICSIYWVDTGQSHPTRGCQMTNLSWWPKPSAWENLGFNVGYWSRDCETWYQKYLAAIRSSTANLKSQAQCKQSIQFMRLSLMAGQKNKLLTAQLLDMVWGCQGWVVSFLSACCACLTTPPLIFVLVLYCHLVIIIILCVLLHRIVILPCHCELIYLGMSRLTWQHNSVTVRDERTLIVV
jgi:hypothetical protein